MNWGSASEFWAMGGYGFYVWGSYLVTLLLLVGEVLLLRARGRAIRRQWGRASRAARNGTRNGVSNET